VRQALHAAASLWLAARAPQEWFETAESYAVPADLFAEWSPSTQARYRKTHRMMSVLGQEPSEQAIKAATCLNGSLNVSRLVDIVSYTFSRRAS
jgi:hypothetical protein